MTTKHSKYPNREFWTVNLAKTKPEDHAEGQGTGLACNINQIGHHKGYWLEVKEELNDGWQSENTKIDSDFHQRELLIKST